MKTCLNGTILRLLSLLLVLSLLAACTLVEAQSTLPTIKIGLVAPFEGLHRPLGYEALFGVKLALQERNSGRGLNGYRVELVALNDFDDPAEAQVQARTLVADPAVLGVVGHLSAAATLATMPIYQQAELAMSVPWPVAEVTPAANDRGVVSVAATEEETLSRLATFGQDMGLVNILELKALPIHAMPDNIQALQLSTEAVTAGEIILALQQAGISLPLLGEVNVGSPQLPQVAGMAANGLIFVSPGPDPRHVPEAGRFVKAYQDLAGFAPGPRAVLAYDATNVLLDAITEVITASKYQPTRAEVSTAITTVKRHGLSGDITFDARGRRVAAPVWIYKISGEEYPGVLITP